MCRWEELKWHWLCFMFFLIDYVMIIRILLLIIYSFWMGSKLNDLITNICCNSESCLPKKIKY